MDNQAEKQLIILAKKGEEQALTMLFQNYLSLVYNFCFHYVKTIPEAEDITQEVFIKVWKNLKKLDETKPFRPWLYKIAKNTCLDWLKKKNIQPLAALPEYLADNLVAESFLDNKYDESDLSDQLSKITSDLPALTAKIFFWRIKEQLTFSEIAKLTKMSINTVKSRYRRSLEIVKSKLRN